MTRGLDAGRGSLAGGTPTVVDGVPGISRGVLRRVVEPYQVGSRQGSGGPVTVNEVIFQADSIGSHIGETDEYGPVGFGRKAYPRFQHQRTHEGYIPHDRGSQTASVLVFVGGGQLNDTTQTVRIKADSTRVSLGNAVANDTEGTDGTGRCCFSDDPFGPDEVFKYLYYARSTLRHGFISLCLAATQYIST